ncbi:MAG: SusE domain-containing protein [Leeuwenhoekiella sp.]
MKTLLKKGLFLLSLTVLVSACTEDEQELTVANEAPPVLADAPIDRIALDVNNTSNPALTLNWTEAEYGLPTFITYNLEVADNADFNNSLIAATTSENNITWSVSQLNGVAGNLEFPPFEWDEIYLRVRSSVGNDGSLAAVSNAINFEVFPYFSYPFLDLYLVGNATPADWNNDNNNPLLFRDPFNENQYSYTGFLSGNQLKILEERGAWAPQYGQEGGLLKARPTDDDPDPAPLDVEQEGYQTFKVNLSTNEYFFTPVTETEILSQVSITGPASTDGEVAMTALASDPHVWFIKSIPLETGTIRFSTSAGTTLGSNTEFSGTATVAGDGIPIPVADDYEVWFSDISGEYIMVPINLSN